ncbi:MULTISPECIES: GNAT family N-acetyltransferase [Microbacterium]|uniref:GNAT family N-acetyltransferase n=1 Tax=Microbacterium TaxID=33882 RepID=UPI001E446187|nr:GNAT family N-acetyltransferase [Microbacterium nymphoidis]MCD2498940.1 GNAT family N-acetyltransferase [Microbacterium nymphoidis]
MTAPRTIRPYRASDRSAVSDICVKTGDSGANAEGLFRHDSLLGDIYAVPYVERHPDLAFVIDDGAGRAIGYVIATDDTEAFNRWFHDEWWPSVRDTYAGDEAAERDAAMLAGAERVGTVPIEYAAEYPAHLHIDILPEGQGGGLGRGLIEAMEAELRRRGVRGLHFVASSRNENALGFYDRLGFTRLPSAPGSQAFGRRFD